MAKKNLASLMDGIIGDDSIRENQESAIPKTSETSDSSDNSELSGADKTGVQYTRRKPGRPPKSAADRLEEVRATIIVEPDVLKKIKYISLIEGSMIKEVMNEAFRSYISAWEAANGKIRLPQKRN